LFDPHLRLFYSQRGYKKKDRGPVQKHISIPAREIFKGPCKHSRVPLKGWSLQS